MIDVIVVVVVVSCTSSCKEVGPKWRRVFGLICCVSVDRRCLLGQGPLHNMTERATKLISVFKQEFDNITFPLQFWRMLNNQLACNGTHFHNQKPILDLPINRSS